MTAAFILALLMIFPAATVNDEPAEFPDGKIKIVSTTGIINDIIKNVGGEKVAATSLMGHGVDPHLYRAAAGDIKKLSSADIIFHHGLHLEGKISDVLKRMKSTGRKTVAITDEIPRSMLISSGGESYDPHVWFDPNLWSFAVRLAERTLSEYDPENSEFYSRQSRAYISKLKRTDDYAKAMSEKISAEKKVIVTSHDAFAYFARAYGFKVAALQGISTVSEASISDIRRAVKIITERKLPAIFTESSVSPRYIEALKEAAEATGTRVKIGGRLYSDALGSEASGHGDFHGMFKHNVDTICLALSGQDAKEIAAIGTEIKIPEAMPR